MNAVASNKLIVFVIRFMVGGFLFDSYSRFLIFSTFELLLPPFEPRDKTFLGFARRQNQHIVNVPRDLQ